LNLEVGNQRKNAGGPRSVASSETAGGGALNEVHSTSCISFLSRIAAWRLANNRPQYPIDMVEIVKGGLRIVTILTPGDWQPLTGLDQLGADQQTGDEAIKLLISNVSSPRASSSFLSCLRWRDRPAIGTDGTEASKVRIIEASYASGKSVSSVARRHWAAPTCFIDSDA
jgi:hypothetical protein